jgi:hypothetical protein
MCAQRNWIILTFPFIVQDEMGYSDDDIDTIFDGDPDAQ